MGSQYISTTLPGKRVLFDWKLSLNLSLEIMAQVVPVPGAIEDGVSVIALESEPVTEQPQASTEAEPEGEGEKEGAAGDEDVDGEADAEDSDAESEPEEESCCNKPLIGSCTLCCFLGMVCAFLAKGKKGKGGSRAMKAKKRAREARRGRRR